MAISRESSLSQTGHHIVESSNILDGDSGQNTKESSIIIDMCTKICQRLDAMEPRLMAIERRLSNVEHIEKTITTMSATVTNMSSEIGSINCTMVEFKSDLTGLSNLFDGLNVSLNAVSDRCESLEARVSCLESKKANYIETTNSKLQDELLDIRCRSMQNNLIFCGLQEVKGEDCESRIKAFIREQMKITADIQFDRVHRLGRMPINSELSKPRKIVARFTKFKDREMIRLEAPKVLKGTPYGVYEQFPIQIEERRRSLYPVLKEAKRRGDRVKLVRDRLYVNNQLYREVSPAGHDTPRSGYNRDKPQACADSPTRGTKRTVEHRSPPDASGSDRADERMEDKRIREDEDRSDGDPPTSSVNRA